MPTDTFGLFAILSLALLAWTMVIVPFCSSAFSLFPPRFDLCRFPSLNTPFHSLLIVCPFPRLDRGFPSPVIPRPRVATPIPLPFLFDLRSIRSLSRPLRLSLGDALTVLSSHLLILRGSLVFPYDRQ